MLKLIRFIILMGLISAAGVYAYDSGLLKLPTNAKVEVPEKVLGIVDPIVNNEQLKKTLDSTKNITQKTIRQAWDKTKTMTIPTKIDGLPQEIVVEDAVNQLVEEVKKLPENQINKVKIQICEGIISSATTSAVPGY